MCEILFSHSYRKRRAIRLLSDFARTCPYIFHDIQCDLNLFKYKRPRSIVYLTNSFFLQNPARARRKERLFFLMPFQTTYLSAYQPTALSINFTAYIQPTYQPTYSSINLPPCGRKMRLIKPNSEKLQGTSLLKIAEMKVVPKSWDGMRFRTRKIMISLYDRRSYSTQSSLNILVSIVIH